MFKAIDHKALHHHFKDWKLDIPRDKTIIGSMSLVYMAGKTVLDTFGRLTESKPPFWSLINLAVMVNIQQ